jgi:hypothetical protein
MRAFWAGVGALGLLTFAGFVVLDPEPDYVLAGASSLNVVVIAWCAAWLHERRLLLSPAASVVIGPGMIVYYSWGNLAARIAGEFRFGGNAGSLEYFPVAAVLASAGLLLFAVTACRLLAGPHGVRSLTYEHLEWQPWQAPVSSAAGLALLTYLSQRYEFRGGYFREVGGDVDRWLASAQYFLLTLGVLIGVSVALRRRDLVGRLVALSAIAIPLVVAVGMRSRTFMIALLVTAASGILTLRPQWVRGVVVGGAALGLVVLGVGSVVKAAGVGGVTESILDNLTAAGDATPRAIVDQTLSSDNPDLEYRAAGFEFPAALVQLLDKGVPPMLGKGVLGGVLTTLPRFVRGEVAEYSERREISLHFLHRGLLYDDSVGIPLTSGIADWGVLLGPVIYVAIALFCVLAWRLVQGGPRLFVAYLMAGAAVGDLFWENAFLSVRSIGFAWLMLLVTGPLLMPRVVPGDEETAEPLVVDARPRRPYVEREA